MISYVAAAILCASSSNFTCNYADQAFAQRVVDVAERERGVRALEWLGKKLPEWSKPCPITVKITKSSGGGATSMAFDRGSVFGWRMRVEGTKDAILNNVLPHEVTHTIMASHFRRPTPRWADEGMATLSEDRSVWDTQYRCLRQTWDTHPISFDQLMRTKEYSKNMSVVMSFYARSAYVTAYLVRMQGRAEFLKFLDTAHRSSDWTQAIRQHYRYESIAALEQSWRGWVASKPVMHEVRLQQQLHLRYFYRSDIVCEGCIAVDRAIARGDFAQFKIEKVDTATPKGYKLYMDTAIACKAANPQFVNERTVPAFHLENRASMKFGFSERRGLSELGAWVTSTLRLPLSMGQAVFNRPTNYDNKPIESPLVSANESKPSVDPSADWKEMADRVEALEENTTPFVDPILVAPEPQAEQMPNIKQIVSSAVLDAVKAALKKPDSKSSPPSLPTSIPVPTDTPGGIPEMLIGAALVGARRWAARKRLAA